MANQLLPVIDRACNPLRYRIAQQTFSHAVGGHNDPDQILAYRGAGWGNGMCPTIVDAAAAIGGGRVGDIVPTDECTFHLEISKEPAGGSGLPFAASGYRWQADFNSITSPGWSQIFINDVSAFPIIRAAWGFVPGWDGAAPPSDTELWALRSGRWECAISYEYTAYFATPFSNVDLLFKTLATTISNQSQAALPNSHSRTSSGTVAFNEDVDLLAHPLWLPRYNLQLNNGGSTYDAIADGTIWFEMDATFTRVGDA